MKIGELIQSLRELAEWAESEIWEVPIILPDALNQAADIIERVWMALGGEEDEL